MSWKVVALVGLVAAAAAGVALAIGDRSTYQVGAHRFDVPTERLITDTIPWLPSPESDGFTFRLELDRTFDKEHHVLVQPANLVCGSDRMRQMIRIACGLEEASNRIAPPYEKVFPYSDYPHLWHYYTRRHEAAGSEALPTVQVADCSPISPNLARPNGTAICTSVWGVDGLVLSLGFEEHEVADLVSMRERATEMLLSWKVR